jgi:hypothetical protein
MKRFGRFLDDQRLMRAARGLFVVLVVMGVLLNAVAIQVAQRADEAQREGRRIAVQSTCAAISAVVDAGRATLLAGAKAQPQPFERNLLKLGFPSLERRRKASELAAATYARSIATEVARITDRKDLVNRDGTLNCALLNKAAVK